MAGDGLEIDAAAAVGYRPEHEALASGAAFLIAQLGTAIAVNRNGSKHSITYFAGLN